MRKVLMTAPLGGAGRARRVDERGAGRRAGCRPTSRSYDLAGFEEISVVGPHHVVVSVGPAFSVRAEGPQQTLADTEVEVEDGRLKIHPIDDAAGNAGAARRQRSRRLALALLGRLPARHLPRDLAADFGRLAGRRRRHAHRPRRRREFSASVAGSGDLDVAALRVDDARFSIAGSGDLVARGSARHSRVSIAGSGNLHAREVTSGEARSRSPARATSR